MRYADVMVGVEYELSVPDRRAPTFEFIQGRVPRIYLDGTPWTVIGKQDGWAMCRTHVEDLDPRTSIGELTSGNPMMMEAEVIVRVRPVRIGRTWAQRDFDVEVMRELHSGPHRLRSITGDWKAARNDAEQAVIARRLDMPDSR